MGCPKTRAALNLRGAEGKELVPHEPGLPAGLKEREGPAWTHINPFCLTPQSSHAVRLKSSKISPERTTTTARRLTGLITDLGRAPGVGLSLPAPQCTTASSQLG